MTRTTAIATFLALAAAFLCAQQEREEGSLRIAALSQEALSQHDWGRARSLVQQDLRHFPADESGGLLVFPRDASHGNIPGERGKHNPGLQVLEQSHGCWKGH